MDNLRGTFETGIPAEDSQDWDAEETAPEEENARELPPEAIGQDERRMQVRAYNHWASLLADATFPSIEELEPHNLTDFGPNSVLLDFSAGIDDPAVQYLGDKLAEECGAEGSIRKLSDVPPRSLLSRITDHYMQILANQAPIGFEAEFVNQRGSSILYRGILLPFSSDDETIDFIYGVINWKEMADAATADELLLEIDQALETDGEEAVEGEEQAHKHHSDPLTEWADSPSHEDENPVVEPVQDNTPTFDNDVEEVAAEDAEPIELGEEHELTSELDENGIPLPDFGQYNLDDPEVDEFGEEIIDEEDEGAGYSFASLSDYIEAPAKKAVDLDADQFDPDDYKVEHEDAPAGDKSEPAEPASLMPEAYEPEEPVAPEAPAEEAAEPEPVAEAPLVPETPANDVPPVEPPDESVEAVKPVEPVAEQVAEEVAEDVAAPVADLPEDAGLYDCLASARELAENARVSEDRSRHALYAAVGRAYDFSLAAKAEPDAFAELVEDSGLTVQDRAPMTPVVKLVFGHDYDKTRLTEYAAVLTHAHRLGLSRGSLADFLGNVEGGLKGVVAAERALRREEAGKDPIDAEVARAKLAKKLRELEELTLEALAGEGPEFSLAVLRRDKHGNVSVIGVDDNAALTEKVAKKLVG